MRNELLPYRHRDHRGAGILPDQWNSAMEGAIDWFDLDETHLAVGLPAASFRG